MPKLILPAIRKEAFIYIGAPFLMALLTSLILLLALGIKAGYSGLLGSLVWVVPNGYAALKLFSNMSAQAAKRIVWNFYLAEILKLLLSVVLFMLIIKLIPLAIGSFFISYLAAQIGFWLMPGFMAMRK